VIQVVLFYTPIGDLCIMESTNNSLNEVSCNNMESTSESSTSSVVSTARTPFRRGMSLKAVVSKAAGWTLEKYKDVTLSEIKECKQT
jgi:hypothetical protein